MLSLKTKNMIKILRETASIATMAMSIAFVSCIREEAPNTEADILTCAVEGIELAQKPVITNNEVRFYVNGWDDRSALAPTFSISEGATIEPESGSVHNFNSPKTYTVTSEDGKWTKTYTVSFTAAGAISEFRSFSFENVKYYNSDGQDFFHIFYETRDDGTTFDWASGNAGFMFTNSSAPAVDYPTAQSDEGYSGKCLKLVTRSTGPLGAMFNSPIAAGNLFLGDFQIDISNTLKSTHFGVPYTKVPKYIAGYYKYQPGPQMTDSHNNNVDGTDQFDIYAVFFEPTDALPYLDGTNVLTADNIVAVGQMDDSIKVADDQWHHFYFELKTKDGKTIDQDKLASGKYSLTIVMTSSVGGASFTGAVGSTLCVDEIQLYYVN